MDIGSWISHIKKKTHYLPEDGLYRYLYEPSEQHGDQKIRATDLIWSEKIYRPNPVIKDQGNRVLYYLQGEHNKVFECEGLMHISEDAQIPSQWVWDWK